MKRKNQVLFEAKNLSKRYGEKTAVCDISFTINEGEVVGLLGPNGSGKTTTFYMSMGLIAPDSGTISFKAERIEKLPIHLRAKRGMGYLSQEPSIFRKMSVEENILCILETLELPKETQEKKKKELLKELGLEKIATSKAYSLSGGERRRVEIARALSSSPSLLLLDEPFAGIDPLAIADLKTLIFQLKAKGISILITDHNAHALTSIIDRGYLLSEGRVQVAGTVEELISNKEALSSYFGKDFNP